MQNRALTKREFIRTTLLALGGAGCISTGKMPAFDSEALPPDLPGRFSKPAMFWTEVPQGVRCQICPNECTIKEGVAGDCRNRMNIKGKLYSIAYGNPCSVNVDPVEKKPLFHFLPDSYSFSIATAGCNLACLNCQNWTISQSSPLETKNYDLMPLAVVDEAIENKCRSIAYTYSEPVTFFEYTLDTSKIARSRGIKNILVSAGYINEPPLREIAGYIDAANIDLKSFSEQTYLKLNGGDLKTVLNTLLVLKEMKVWLEITNLVIPSWTDDMNMIKDMCSWLMSNGFEDCPLHFSRFYPQYKLTRLPATPVATLEKARDIALEAGMKFVYIGNISGSEAANTYCPKCHKIIVERKGFNIMSNNIKAGKCGYCGESIPGVWT